MAKMTISFDLFGEYICVYGREGGQSIMKITECLFLNLMIFFKNKNMCLSPKDHEF